MPRRTFVSALIGMAATSAAGIAFWVQLAPATVTSQHDSVASFPMILSHDFGDGEEQVGVVRFQRITPSLWDASKEWVSVSGHVYLEPGTWCVRTAVAPADPKRRLIRTRIVRLSAAGTITFPAIKRQRYVRGKTIAYARVWPGKCGGSAFTATSIQYGGECSTPEQMRRPHAHLHDTPEGPRLLAPGQKL